MSLVVNTRILDKHLTGVQRYTSEILKRLDIPAQSISPRKQFSAGIRGHFWEQAILPWKMGKEDYLWSPSNTGPLQVSNQVVTIHDLVPIDHPEWLSKPFATWYQFLLPRLAKRCAHILTVSEFSKQRIVEMLRVPDQKVTVTGNGVSALFHPKDTTAVLQMRRQLNLGDTPYFLSVGSLEPRKNLTTLLKAWQKVSPLKNLSLVIAGVKGFERIFGHCQEPLLQLPNILCIGHVPDDLLPALYSGANAFFYLSSYEGFGIPPLEAMACGTLTCTSNRTALPEVTGQAGILVDPFDVNSVAEIMYSIHTGTINTADYFKKGIQQAQHFSWEKVAAKTANILNKVGSSLSTHSGSGPIPKCA